MFSKETKTPQILKHLSDGIDSEILQNFPANQLRIYLLTKRQVTQLAKGKKYTDNAYQSKQLLKKHKENKLSTIPRAI